MSIKFKATCAIEQLLFRVMFTATLASRRIIRMEVRADSKFIMFGLGLSKSPLACLNASTTKTFIQF